MFCRVLCTALVLGAFACNAESASDGEGGSGGGGSGGSGGTAGAGFEIWDDEESGLSWIDPSGPGSTWQDAIDFCTGLTLEDHGDWRLPDIGELRSLIRGCANTELSSDCDILDGSGADHLETECLGCEKNDGPANEGCYWDSNLNGTCIFYWSSSTYADDETMAWSVYFVEGSLKEFDKGLLFNTRCVRDTD